MNKMIEPVITKPKMLIIRLTDMYAHLLPIFGVIFKTLMFLYSASTSRDDYLAISMEIKHNIDTPKLSVHGQFIPVNSNFFEYK